MTDDECGARLLGQEAPLAQALAAIRRGRVAQAQILAGAAGSGKGLLAEAIACALLCESPDPQGAGCGRCLSCQGVCRGTHPNLSWIGAAGKVGIDEARRLRREAALSPSGARCAVFVVEAAERLTGPAAVALLKTLEDPPAPVVILLLTEHPDQLEPTLRSRCLVLRLRPVGTESVRRWLSGLRPEVSDARREDAVRAAQGWPGRALARLEDAAPGADADAVGQALCDALDGTAGPARTAAVLAEAAGSPARVLEVLRDALVLQLGLTEDITLCSGASRGALQALAPHVSRRLLTRVGPACLRLQEGLAANVSASLGWHIMANRLHASKAPC